MRSTIIAFILLIISFAGYAQQPGLVTTPKDSLQCKVAEPSVLLYANHLLSTPCTDTIGLAATRRFLLEWMRNTPDYHFHFQDPLFRAVEADAVLSARYMACQCKVALTEVAGISSRDFQLKYVRLFLEYCHDAANNARLPAAFANLEEERGRGRLEDALVLNYVSGLRAIIDTAKSDSVKLLYLNAISNAYRDVNPDSMVYYAQQGVHFSMRNSGNLRPGAEARALNFLGGALWYAGNYPEAKDAFFKALQHAELLHDTLLIGWVYNGLAMVNRNEGNYRQAIRYAGKAEQQTARIPDNDALLEAIASKGKTYEQLGMLDSAFSYTQFALAMQQRKYKGRNVVGGAVQANMGIICSRMGNAVMATEFFTLSFRLNKEINDQRRLARAYCEYAEHFARNGRQDSAIYYATMGLIIDRQYRFLVQQLAASDLLTRLYTKENKTDSAFKYLQLMVATRDSLFSREKVNRLQTLEFNEQIRQGELEAARQQAELQRRQNIQYELIALGIIIFVILFAILSRRFITSVKWIEFFLGLALLVTFEFINVLLGPFVDRITGQLPVLVLLASVLVAVLLVPVHNAIEKWSKEKLVEKNKRVQQALEKVAREKLEHKD